MKLYRQRALALLTCILWGLLAGPTTAEEGKKKIVFIAGNPSHGYGSHEHNAGCDLLSRLLRMALPEAQIEVVHNGWPKDPSILSGASAIVMYCDGGRGHMVVPHRKEVDALAKKGTGIVCIHYGVEVEKDKGGVEFLDWIGGYFEMNWSVNPHWTATFDAFPEHPITRGVKPFEINDEWYYHMRFRPEMKGVVPILTALPPASTLSRGDGPHSGNPDVRQDVLEKKIPQHVAWASENEGGGRGFGFTGGHDHWNWGEPNFRKLVLNAIAWTAQIEVPKNGITDAPVTLDDLVNGQDEPIPGNLDRAGIGKKIGLPVEDPSKNSPEKKTSSRKKTAAQVGGGKASSHDAAHAVAHLDVADGCQATLFSSEPQISNITSIDIDHLGRIWAAEVKNYRRHRNSRPEGDRILVLEDTNGDGKADIQTVFYQGRDIDSAHGICILGDRLIVSAGDKVQVFYDDNGDLQSDRKETLFSGISGTQHDHGIHAFAFGPDGKLYFNFGNSGERIKDKDGKPLIDLAGNEINNSRKPYQEGMVFRCNLDGSKIETLGWNFRNNWEVAVDSFGTLWQSDNDDDGNHGVRINYVMEFGNFGYKDELTGAGWGDKRTNIEKETPLRHWHLNDPGVVPNLLNTGAGSPTGITVYEGSLLPPEFHNQIIHCDAGPNICRAYPVTKSGAGYKAEIIDVLYGARDNWYRPSDVCTAPDGSLFIADWYDPGVGGHNQQEVDKGRIFRVAPLDVKYHVPAFDFSTAQGAAQALKNPNLSVRFLAFTSLCKLGKQAASALQQLYNDKSDPRLRARALWILGQIEGESQTAIAAALIDSDPDIRITGLRLARELKLDMTAYIKQLVNDSDPAVRRECAIALRHSKSPQAAELWAQLAQQHDGQDRWYVEALGIAADQNWDAYLAAYLNLSGDLWNSPAGHDIVWRSRAQKTPELLARIIKDPSTLKDDQPRYMRAFDFLTKGPEKDQALQSLLELE
ncbi:MAG: hypothetical protein DWI25_09280 [Planctomycetota bacterium]|nr:MAG: hypothetical protein DWI25_09280 [Planctomycetota bacterium]